MESLEVKVNMVLKEILDIKDNVVIKVNWEMLDHKVNMIVEEILELKMSMVLEAQRVILEEVELVTCVDGYRI